MYMQSLENIKALLPNEFILLDTEFTAWEGSKERAWSLDWEEKEIIQIGAIRVHYENDAFHETDKLMADVKPEINPKLSDYITKLTGIRQEQLDVHGIDLVSALSEFHRFTQDGRLPIFSWGGDEKVIQYNCKLRNIPHDMENYYFHDIRNIFNLFDPNISRLCSGEVAGYFGKSIEGHHHSALHDVRSILSGINALSAPPKNI